MIVSTYPSHVILQINFCGSEIRNGIFGGLNFGLGIFCGF